MRRLSLAFVLLVAAAHSPAVAAAQDTGSNIAHRAAQLRLELAPAVATGDAARAQAIAARDAEAARALYRELLFDAATAKLYGHPALPANDATRALLAGLDAEGGALEAKYAEWLRERKPGAGFQNTAGVEQAIYFAVLTQHRFDEKETSADAPAGTVRELTERALAQAETAGLDLAVASFAGNLAVYAVRDGRLNEAPPLVARAEEIWTRWNHPVGLFQAPQLLGIVAYRSERWKEAAELFAVAAERAAAGPELLPFRVGLLADLAASRRNTGDREGVRAALAAAVEGQRQLLNDATDEDERLKRSKTLADFEVQLGGALAALARHAEAADRYVRAEKLKQENYQTERARFEAQLAETTTKMRARIDESQSEEMKKLYRGTLETLTDTMLSILDALASQSGDTEGQARVAERRLAVAREGGNPANIARALETVAKAHRAANDLRKARAAAEEALAMRRADPRRTHLYETVALLGDLAYYAEDWEAAAARYQEVIALTQPGALPPPFDLDAQTDEGLRRTQARMNAFDLMTRRNQAIQAKLSLALIREQRGDYRAADMLLNEAEADIPQLYAAGAPDGAELARWLEGRKTTRTTALDVAQRRRETNFTPDDDERKRFEMAELTATAHRISVLNYRAMLLEGQNDLDGAAKAYEDAFNLTANFVGGAFELSARHVALARIERERGNYAAAEAPLEAALADAIRKNSPGDIAAMLSQLGALRRDQGRLEESRRLAEDALKLARGLDSRTQVAAALRTLGRTESEMGGEHLKRAEQHLGEALAIWRGLGLRAHVPYTLDSLGLALERQGREEEALAAYREAVEIVETLAGSLASGASAETFNASRGNRDLYEHLIRLLIRRNRASEALHYLERSKSKALVDALAGASVTAQDPALRALLRRVREAGDAARAAERELADELSKPDARRDAGRVASLRASAAAARQEHLAAVEQLKRTNPSYASLVAVKPTDLEEVRRRLPAKTLLVSYFPTDTSLYLFTVTREREPRVRAVAKGRKELARLIAEYRAAVTPHDGRARGLGGGGEAAPAGRLMMADPARVRELTLELYDVLLAPAAEEIESAETILLVPADELYYMPIHALGHEGRDGKFTHLIESKRFAYLASADLLSVVSAGARGAAGASMKESGLLAVGNPDGSLPAAGEEVAKLSSIFPKAQVFMGDEATIEHIARPGAAAPFVHFATHGVINSRDPKESFLLLAGRPGRLTVRDLVEDTYKLSFAGTRIVTLSACETNLGGWDPSAVYGSLSRAFSKAGAPTVVASLWSVSDDSTRDTMTVFYRELAAGRPKAEALRRAQLSIMRDPRYAHPFYWAPFIILGEWR